MPRIIHRSIALLAVSALFLAGPPAPAQTGGTPGSNQVRPGDVVKLQIWREPDLSGEFAVHDDGTVVLPRVGVWNAAGKSPQDLRHELTDAFSETLRNPSIDVRVLLRISIIGEVGSPGLYTVDPTMSVSDALAMAGGPRGSANKGKIVLVRGSEEIDIDLDEKYSIVDLNLQSGDRIYVPERNWFVRNLPLVTSVLGLVTTVIALSTR